MQERQVLSFLAYVWALGIVPTMSPVSADGETPVLSQNEGKIFDADAIKTEVELQAALSDPETVAITLASDIITIDNLIVNRNDSIELNLNGYKIASLTKNARVIDVQAGDIALLGLGSIVATGAGASAIRIRGAITADNVNYSRITVGADVTLYAPNYYGIFVTTSYNAAYGVTVDFYGSIIAHDGICIHGNISGHGDNVPHINLQDGSKIIADENEGTAICAFGRGIWEIGAAEITGGTGLNVKSGALTLRQSNLIATGDCDTFPGSGTAIRFEDNLAHYIKLKIISGSYLSVQGYVFYEHSELNNSSSLQTLEIYDGVFSGQLGTCLGLAPRGSANAATYIYGGKFNTDISRYLAPEHHVEQHSVHGEYVVIDDTEPTQIIDKAEQLKIAKSELEELIAIAKRYTKPSYAGKELGELQATVNKIIGTIKRSIKASEKLLNSSDVGLSKVKNSTRRLEDHLSEIRAIEDGMRAEINEAIDFSKLDQTRYTPDSFLDLSLAIADAEQLLAADFATLVELQDMLGVIDAAKIMLEESDEYIENFALETETLLADFASPESKLDLELESELAPEPSTPEELPATSTVATNLPVETSLSEPPLRPAPKLFLGETEPQSSTDIEQVLDSFVDDFEEPVDPIEAAFAIDDLEMEEMSEVESFVHQIKTAELIAESVSDNPEPIEFENNLESQSMMQPEPDLVAPEPSFPVAEPEPPIPVFVDPELAAAKQSLRNLLNAISALDPADYTIESYTILARTASMAGNLLSENSIHTTTAVLLSAFNSVSMAYERLVKKSENPTSATLETVELNLRSMLDAVQSLTVNDYETNRAEQFGELQVAIAKAKALLARDLPNLPDVLNVMDEIKLATSGLKGAAVSPQPNQPLQSQPVQPVAEPVATPSVENSTFNVYQPVTTNSPSSQVFVTLDWSGLTEALNDIRALNAADYTSESYQKLLAVLENAKVVSGKSNLTQAEIDEIVFELNLAILALERPATPRLSETQTFSESASAPRTMLSTADVSRVTRTTSATQAPMNLATDDNVTPSLLMSMMAGAYAGLATYRRSRLEAKKRKNFHSA